MSAIPALSQSVGNSSSGILEAASFRLPVVNLGTRQHGRLRAANVVDAGYDTNDIMRAIGHVLNDAGFRQSLCTVNNPYGDGHTADKTADILARARLVPGLLAKWLAPTAPFVD